MWAEVKSQHKSGYSAPESALQAGVADGTGAAYIKRQESSIVTDQIPLGLSPKNS